MTIDRLERQNLGGNDPCPVCGRKMKNCNGHRLKFSRRTLVCFASTLAIIVLLAGLGMIRWLHDHHQSEQTMSERPFRATPQAIARFKQMVEKHAIGSPEDSWWLTTWPHTPEELPATVAKCEAILRKMKTLLSQYRHVSPLAREIADAFPSFNMTVYHRGARIKVPALLGNEGVVTAGQNLEVCLVPSDEVANMPARFFYLGDWQSLVLAGVELPDVVFAAMLYHELGHALLHRQDAPSVFAPTDSDADVDEENEMHWLGEQVLNAASEGKLLKQLDGIIGRQADRSAYKAALLGWTEEDYQRCYACLGVPRPSRLAQKILDVAIWHALGQRMIRTSLPSTAWVAEERKLYRWFSRYFMSP